MAGLFFSFVQSWNAWSHQSLWLVPFQSYRLLPEITTSGKKLWEVREWSPGRSTGGRNQIHFPISSFWPFTATPSLLGAARIKIRPINLSCVEIQTQARAGWKSITLPLCWFTYTQFCCHGTLQTVWLANLSTKIQLMEPVEVLWPDLVGDQFDSNPTLWGDSTLSN